MARAQIAAAAVVIKTALLVEAEHPEIWADARRRVTAKPAQRPLTPATPTHMDDPLDYLAVLDQMGGTATDTEWKRECARLLGAGRRRYEYARAALLDRGLVTMTVGNLGSLKLITWSANTPQNEVK